MYRRTIYKVVCPESRKRIALQCVDLLLPGATPPQRKKIANRILAMCDSKVVWIEEGRKPRRMTPDLLSELIAVHAQCVLDQQGKCTLTVFTQPLAWEINQAMWLANEEDKGFRRDDPVCAARPLGAERFDLSEDRLLDAIYDILQVNLALLKNGHLEHDDHAPYFRQCLAILKAALRRDE